MSRNASHLIICYIQVSKCQFITNTRDRSHDGDTSTTHTTSLFLNRHQISLENKKALSPETFVILSPATRLAIQPSGSRPTSLHRFYPNRKRGAVASTRPATPQPHVTCPELSQSSQIDVMTSRFLSSKPYVKDR